MEQMEQQEVVKAAAKRMCEFLGDKGIRVKHAQMLEALAKGLGVESWRALKATLDSPKTTATPTVDSAPASVPLGVMQSWTIDAMYRDNDQLYGDINGGRTPLEAAVSAMIERLTDWGNEIDVLAVVAEVGENRWDASFRGDIQLGTNREALETVLRWVPLQNRMTSREAWQARNWLEAVIAENREDDFSRLTDYDNLNGLRAGSGGITDQCALTPSQALTQLCELALQAEGGVLAFEAAHETDALRIYQVIAMCVYFEDYINHEDSGLTGFEE